MPADKVLATKSGTPNNPKNIFNNIKSNKVLKQPTKRKRTFLYCHHFLQNSSILLKLSPIKPYLLLLLYMKYLPNNATEKFP